MSGYGTGGIHVKDESATVLTSAPTLDFQGAGVTVSQSGEVAIVTIPGTTGEANTASNANLAGQGIFYQKVGVDLQFYGVEAASNKVTIALNGSNKTITVDVAESNLTLSNLGGTLGTTKGGTNLTSYTTGDLLYSSATNTLSKLAGNITTTRKFLSQTGDGAASAAPAWNTVAANDLPTTHNSITVDGRLQQKTVALSDGTNIAVDASLGNIFTVTLGGNRTMSNPSNAPASGFSQKIEFWVKQDGSGSRTLAWDTKYRFSTDVPSPTLTTTASKLDRIAFAYHQADDKWDCLAVNKGF